MKKNIFGTLGDLFLKSALGFFVFWMSFASVPFVRSLITNSETMKKFLSHENYLVIAETSIKIDIADTKSKRVKGLSGQDFLETNRGLYFVFDSVDKHGIWMKDMNFPIDIVWISESLEVVYILADVSPETFPNVFEPTLPAKYVLEVSDGFIKRNGIKVGDQVTMF